MQNVQVFDLGVRTHRIENLKKRKGAERRGGNQTEPDKIKYGERKKIVVLERVYISRVKEGEINFLSISGSGKDKY